MTQTTEAERRTSNVAKMRAITAAVNSGDEAAQREHLADDISYEAPYYSLHVTGKDRLVAMFQGLRSRFREIDYQITEVYPALDPDLVIYEQRGDNPVIATGRRYQNHYVMFAWFRDGKVVRWVEYSNPKVYDAANNP